MRRKRCSVAEDLREFGTRADGLKLAFNEPDLWSVSADCPYRAALGVHRDDVRLAPLTATEHHHVDLKLQALSADMTRTCVVRTFTISSTPRSSLPTDLLSAATELTTGDSVW